MLSALDQLGEVWFNPDSGRTPTARRPYHLAEIREGLYAWAPGGRVGAPPPTALRSFAGHS